MEEHAELLVAHGLITTLAELLALIPPVLLLLCKSSAVYRSDVCKGFAQWQPQATNLCPLTAPGLSPCHRVCQYLQDHAAAHNGVMVLYGTRPMSEFKQTPKQGLHSAACL